MDIPVCYGGESGIRTHDGVTHTRVPGERTKPDYATSPSYIFNWRTL
jgi:hypothetical protein